jgi:hypothetical protein
LQLRAREMKEINAICSQSKPPYPTNGSKRIKKEGNIYRAFAAYAVYRERRTDGHVGDRINRTHLRKI